MHHFTWVVCCLSGTCAPAREGPFILAWNVSLGFRNFRYPRGTGGQIGSHTCGKRVLHQINVKCQQAVWLPVLTAACAFSPRNKGCSVLLLWGDRWGGAMGAQDREMVTLMPKFPLSAKSCAMLVSKTRQSLLIMAACTPSWMLRGVASQVSLRLCPLSSRR